MHCKTGNVLLNMLNVLRKCEFYICIKTSFKVVVSSFTLRCRSPKQSPGLPWRNSLLCRGRANVEFHNQLFPVGEYQICPAQSPLQGGLLPGYGKQGTLFFFCFHKLWASSFPLFTFSALSFFLLQMLSTWCQFDMTPYIYSVFSHCWNCKDNLDQS